MLPKNIYIYTRSKTMLDFEFKFLL